MSRIAIVLFLVLALSCKKEPGSKGSKLTQSVKNKIAAKSSSEKISSKVDTLFLSSNEESDKTSYILAHLLDQKADKDSIVTAKYRLDFYSNKIKIASEKVAIVPFTQGSSWGASYGIPQKDNTPILSFIHLSFGYEACGYNQQQFLFYLKDNTLQLVHQWDSMSDGGWGTWIEFGNSNPKNELTSFYCKTVSYGYKEGEENEEIGTIEYSDSTGFHLKNKRWIKQLLSPKEKVYWKKDIPFNVFYAHQ
jgi:hypothetical protein